MDRIVLAYSGSLSSSIAIPWLKATHQAEIVAVTLDVGQGRELEAVRDRALAAGALRAHVLDVRDEFARDYILPALKAGAIRGDALESGDPLATALSRPLIALKLVEIAAIEGATRVAHGCQGKGSDRARLETAIRALNPGLTILPLDVSAMNRSQQVEYAQARSIPVPFAAPYHADANLWARVVQHGTAEDLWREPAEEIYALTRAPLECPDEPASLEIAFDRGVPVAINGVPMSAVELIGSIGTIAGAHGVGRMEIGDDGAAGARSRAFVEAPAATVLYVAHGELQKLMTPRDLRRFARTVSAEYARLLDAGSWFTPFRRALDGFVERAQENVTGVIRLRLFKGDCRVTGRKSSRAAAPSTAEPTIAAGAGKSTQKHPQ
jgi:argininosuccinate synthase